MASSRFWAGASSGSEEDSDSDSGSSSDGEANKRNVTTTNKQWAVESDSGG